jgi:hypothetical protein
LVPHFERPFYLFIYSFSGEFFFGSLGERKVSSVTHTKKKEKRKGKKKNVFEKT